VPLPRSFARPLARPLAVAALCAAAAAAACRDLAFEPENPATVAFAPELGINISQFTQLPSGVYVQEVATGSGAVVTDSSTIRASYRGTLANGRLFDSATIQVDLRTRIPGWQSGLVGARAGSRRRLVIPPSQAYGDRSQPGIPAGSVLYFVIDLVSVTTPTTPPPTTPPTTGAGRP
jgi:FKBP-type peptidyl-prolyl cis-trans isomerase